jgi:lipopolysaccharide export system protein LptA
MKYSKGGMLVGSIILMAVSAVAAMASQSLTLNQPVQVNGKQLSAGSYKLNWNGSGPDVQVQIMQGKHLVATAPAKIVEAKPKSNGDAAVIETSGGGRSLVEARFGGKNYKLVFGSETAQTAQPARSAGGDSSEQ